MAAMKDYASPSQETLSPRDLMRARHPDLYSDSQVNEHPKFSKDFFGHYLDTLTSRKQEYEFEYFCRKLAEKELCPNLRPQTGPTGGGDSKVDTETYPVAEEISERWLVGAPSAGSERWAFAFSAKKKWQPKIKADVDNIVSTGRRYDRIYFFTNQYVSDKVRSSQEDSLSKHAGVPVHIVDRSWIIERVFENKQFDLAIDTLNMQVDNDREVRQGPRDVARLAELEELDLLIADSDRYTGARYQLVEDCLRTAILARGLERPRNEVESRFAQADYLSQKMDLRHQRLRIAYNRAWTAFWWYEDFSDFNRFYDEVEKRVEGTDQASDAELLLNLWHLLAPSVSRGQISEQDAKIAPRHNLLVAILEAMAANPVRLNNALQARTSLVLIKLTQAFQARKNDVIEEVWRDFSVILDDASSLGDYSVGQMWSFVREIGDSFDSPGFDVFYEKLVGVLGIRRSEGEAGEAFSERGLAKLNSDKPYEAIQWFGKAEELLIKEECREELVMALLSSSYAYERVGLLWAARVKTIAAIERVFTTFNAMGEMAPHALFAAKRLVWIELQLGRIPHILGAVQLCSFVAAHLEKYKQLYTKYRKEVILQDGVLGIHFLNLPISAMSDLGHLPVVLERLGCLGARMALLFALGHEQELRDEGTIPAIETGNSVQSFFEQLHDQPAAQDIPDHPLLVTGATTLLKTLILGSELVVEADNNPTSFGLAESILGIIEAFMATSNDGSVFPHRERVLIRLVASDKVGSLSPVTFLEGSDRVEVVHPAELNLASAPELKSYRVWLGDLIPGIVARMFIPREANAWLEKIGGQERAFSRALYFGDSLTLARNVFGPSPKLLLSDWRVGNGKHYAALRSKPWRVNPRAACTVRSSEEPLRFGAGTPPAGLFDSERLKHSDMRVLSPIDTPLWDRAKWQGTLYGVPPQLPPALALVFEDGEAGQSIFRAWRDTLSTEDEAGYLRVSIVTGLSKVNPAEYAVIVGANPTHLKGATMIFMGSRILRMTPSTSTNLDRFLAAYRRERCYAFMPAKIVGDEPTLFAQLTIVKYDISVRPAWQIGENDPDLMALQDDDDPIIPPKVSDPPVAKAMAQIRGFRASRRA